MKQYVSYGLKLANHWCGLPPPHLIFALCSRLCSVFCLCFFFIWMAADVTGPLMDRYECLLWQENCCTIFLYSRWASSLNLVRLEDQWVNSATNNEQRHLIGLLFSRWTTAILYITRRDGRDLCGFATRWVAHLIIATRSLCASPPPDIQRLLTLWSCDSPPLCLCVTLSVLCTGVCMIWLSIMKSWRYMFLCDVCKINSVSVIKLYYQ